MDLVPRINSGAFQCFWSAPCAWGNFELTPQRMTLTTAAGAIPLRQVAIVPFRHPAQRKLKVTSAGREIEHSVTPHDSGALLQFSQTLEVNVMKPLEVQT
jgi:hypothetical protein